MNYEHKNPNTFIKELLLSVAELIVFSTGLLFVIVPMIFRSKLSDDAAVVLVGIGTSLLATSISLFIINSSWENLKSIRGDIRRIYPRRAYVAKYVYSNYIVNAKQRIWVQGVSLNRFLSQNLNDLENAAKKGVDVRLLFLSHDPVISYQNNATSFLDFSYYQEHAAAKFNPSQGSHDIVLKISSINDTNANYKGYNPIKYKLYTSCSSNMVFLIDDLMFAGPYLHGIDSGDVYTLLLSPGSIYDCYYNHFSNLWADTRFTRDFN